MTDEDLQIFLEDAGCRQESSNQWQASAGRLFAAMRAAIAADRDQPGHPVPHGETLRLAKVLETLAEDYDQGSPIERSLEAAAALLRRQQPQPVAWCRSEEFAASRRNGGSFNGWRDPGAGPNACDMRLYALLPAAVVQPVTEESSATQQDWEQPQAAVANPVLQFDQDLEAWLTEKMQIPGRVHLMARMEARAALDQPAITPTLKALLSPQGAYEPGTGEEDGAQLVNRTWWAPLHGCDSLDDLLERIRARILPHLRPPVEGIDVPGPDGDWACLQALCEAEKVPVEPGARLLRRAMAAWETRRDRPQPVQVAVPDLPTSKGLE